MSGRDKRRSFRMLLEQTERGELIFDQLRVPIEIVDQSAGGFAAISDAPVSLPVGTLGRLSTAAGDCQVRVAYLRNAQQLDQEQPSAGGSVRIGLEWVQDLVSAEQEAAMPRWTWKTLLRAPWSVLSDMSTTASAIVMVLSLLVVPLAIMTVLLNLEHPAVQRCTGWCDAVVEYVSSGFSSDKRWSWDRRLPTGESVGQAANSSTGAAVDLAETAARQAAQDAERLRSTVQRLPGVTPLTLPEVVQELRLTPQQQAEIAKLVDLTSEAIRELDEHRASSNRQQMSQQRQMVHETVRREALQVLTPQQRAQWKTLTGE